jgi:hypothetical protein
MELTVSAAATRQSREPTSQTPSYEDPFQQIAKWLDRDESAFTDALQKQLQCLAATLGERSIGGERCFERTSDLDGTTSEPGDPPKHTSTELRKAAARYESELTSTLLGAPDQAAQTQILRLLYLWKQSWSLWDRAIPYRTLKAVDSVVNKLSSQLAEQYEGAQRWESLALEAACNAIRIVKADADLFEQVSLSNAERLAEVAAQAIDALEETQHAINAAREAIPRPVGGGNDDPIALIDDALCDVESACRQSLTLYRVKIADTIAKFERWIARAPRIGSQDALEEADATTAAVVSPAEMTAMVEGAVGRLHKAIAELEGEHSTLILSRCEPWERLLEDIREIVAANETVFVPKRVWIRYCYPFAVDFGPDDPAEIDRLTAKIDPCLTRPPGAPGRGPQAPTTTKWWSTLEDFLGADVQKPEPLEPSAFWQGSGDGLYGGVRIELPKLNVLGWWDISGRRPEQRREEQKSGQLRAWIELNRMGNYCLCIEPVEPLERILPHLLYRALRVGTQFVRGAVVWLAGADCPDFDQTHGPREQDTDEMYWDDLHLFAHDVILATKNAIRSVDDRRPRRHQKTYDVSLVRGHLHEILVVQTHTPLTPEPAHTTQKLDDALGGRLLLRPVHRQASTLAEWLRLQTLQGSCEGAAPMPELGFAGDWMVDTGDASVFGISTTPSWLRDCYIEAAQFAASWGPLLELWHERLSQMLHEARRDDDTRAHAADDLRRIDQDVRRLVLALGSEQLCQTRAHRRTLDRLLKMGGVMDIVQKLEDQLVATGRYADWISERTRRTSEGARNVFLVIIGVLAVFDLAHFLSLADDTHFDPFRIHLFAGEHWEGWAVVILFAVVTTLGVIALLWPKPWHWIKRTWHRIKRTIVRRQTG